MSGDYYTTLTDNELRIELYNLACRAIAAFKFPKFPLDYDAKYTKHTTSINHKDVEEEVTAADDWNDIHPFFTSDEVTYREIEVIIAWMKVYWAEEQASNADNYVDIYTDSNIKTFSRANAMDKFIKFYTTYKEEAKELENRYSRVTLAGKSALGEVNEDE